ncbi:hypothetical protein SAY87_021913 [Trapa incisa]|uniref:Uncharacterized protein n=1 Tax=Trapa incisa TaxID=236973 RepID=A0AAN7JUL6_9MYRT|nr:hypothetical protein SAY87_021913 [Trapa incisa]
MDRGGIDPTQFSGEDSRSRTGSSDRDPTGSGRTLTLSIGLRVHALSISGTIPDELWNLTHLFLLDMGRNVLTGTVSPAIANLNQMKYLNLVGNNFTITNANISWYTKYAHIVFG